jgi:hypothetical protein
MSAPSPQLARPSQADLDLLLAQTGLCVSILINTRPGERLGDQDAARLRAHARDVVRRLEMEPDSDRAQVLAKRLAAALEAVPHGPTDRALAVFVSETFSAIHHLPVGVEERVVLDPTFATRDVVRSVQANPVFLLLNLDHRSARLYRYNQKYLAPVLSPDFPAVREGRVRARGGEEALRAFLRHVDAGIGHQLREDPAPVILVGGDRVLAEYLRVTRHGGRIAGMSRGTRSRVSHQELERIGRSAMAEHVADLAAAAHDTLHARLRSRQAVSGLLGCWHAAHSQTPELLLVEQRFALPVRLVADGKYVEPADDAEHPETIDDAVDDLIEKVIMSGGHVSVVPDGALRDHGRVAMTLAG